MSEAASKASLSFGSIDTPDKLKLPSLLYEPRQTTKKAAIWLHGMGDSGIFYKPDRINALGEAMCERGIAFLAFNNRGAHNRKSLTIDDETLPEEDRTYIGGTFYETIEECLLDIDGAAGFLRDKGYDEMYLIGHSSGANKICVYASKRPQTAFSKYVFAGPGDDTGLFYETLGDKKFWLALDYAAKSIQAGNPGKQMPIYTGMHPFSARSAWDILDPEGLYNTFPYYESLNKRLGEKTLFSEYGALKKPTLVVIGELDEYMTTAGSPQGALDILMQHTSNQMLKQTDFKLIDGADHSFSGQEEVFAEYVARWLADD